jgi:aspartate beta-hydroxylase
MGVDFLARAQAANIKGLNAIRARDGAAAVSAFLEAVAADGTSAALWVNLAHGHRLMADAAGERVALERALEIDRSDFIAQLRIAQLYQRIGDKRASLEAWELVRHLSQSVEYLPPTMVAEVVQGEAYAADLRQRLAREVQASTQELIAAGHEAGTDETADRRIRAFVDTAVGDRRIFTNICSGLYYPFLPADEFFDRRHFPWLDELEATASVVRAEMDALLAEACSSLRPYVQMEKGLPHNLWTDLDHSREWTACFLWEYGKPNDEVIAKCPETAAILRRLPLLAIPGRGPNAFFSILAPNGRIPPHTGVTNTRAIIHVGLDVPDGCAIRVGGETRCWDEGKAFAFDDTIEHEVWNSSDHPRTILILDCWNPHLSASERTAITRYFMTSEAVLK